MITFQVELFADTYEEALPLLRMHWEEVGLHREIMPFDPDVGSYLANEQQGMLHIVTARQDGRMIGYHCSFVRPHVHYASTLTAFTDIYFIEPSKRGIPTVAVRLFREVKRTLQQRGVRRIITTTKTHLDKSRLLEHLGYSEIERVYEQLI
jgi:hypothetical protein